MKKTTIKFPKIFGVLPREFEVLTEMKKEDFDQEFKQNGLKSSAYDIGFRCQNITISPTSTKISFAFQRGAQILRSANCIFYNNNQFFGYGTPAQTVVGALLDIFDPKIFAGARYAFLNQAISTKNAELMPKLDNCLIFLDGRFQTLAGKDFWNPFWEANPHTRLLLKQEMKLLSKVILL